jgi:hypothetical protein
MPGKQEMRAKARELLDSPRGKQIVDYTRISRHKPVPQGFRGIPRIRGESHSPIEQDVLNEAYELAAARRPVPTRGAMYKPREQVGPMTEDTRRQTRRGVRGEAPKFADGGKVRGDGICQRGKTKGRLV